MICTMKEKLNRILLIDDDQSDNYLHSLFIEEAQICHHIEVASTAPAALEYLNTKKEGAYPQPELIFLDINMPKVNGFEFLEGYRKLEISQHSKAVIIMLTTSINPFEMEKAKNFPEIRQFRIKPLSPEMIAEILESCFADYL